jgi:NADH-quinone oxidoreductase subunit G
MEGRAQSFNGSVKPRGETRPGWKVLRVLGNLMDVAGFDYESSEAVRTEVTGGATDLSARCTAAAVPSRTKSVVDGAGAGAEGLERIADVPIYFSDPLVRRSAPLQATRDARPPVVRANGRALASLGLVSDDIVDVAMAGGEPCRLSVQLDERVGDGCVAIAAGHPTTAGLPAAFGRVTLTKVGHGAPPTGQPDPSRSIDTPTVHA